MATGTMADLEVEFLKANIVAVLSGDESLPDLRMAYYEEQTGLTDQSISDLRMRYFETQTLSTGSLADLEVKFLRTATVAVGEKSLADLRMAYYQLP